MRIFVDARMLHLGGTLTVAIQLLAALVERYGDRHEFTVLHARGQPWKGPPPRKLIHTRGNGAVRWLAGDRFSLPRLVARERPDLYHSLKRPQIRAVRGPKILTIHSAYPFLYPEFRGFAERIYWAPEMARSARAADLVCAVSETDRRSLCDTLGLPRQKVVAVPNAVDPGFAPVTDAAELAALRRRYDLPERYVLFVGNAYSYKNLPGIVTAWDRAVSSAGLPHGFVWAGGGGHAVAAVEAAIATAAQRDRIRRLGPLTRDLAALYSAADLFCFPTWYDSFGIPVLEAMACGAPVLASTTGALPEVAGDAAWLVDPADVDAIADGIVRLLGDPAAAEALRAKGFARARGFSWRRSADRQMDVYRRLCG